MRVRYTPRTRSDLQAILQYIDQRSPLGARKVKRAIQKTIELIGEFPEAGRRSGEEATRVLAAGRYPYLIYWAFEGDEAWILHIRHARRRPWRGQRVKGSRQIIDALPNPEPHVAARVLASPVPASFMRAPDSAS